MRLTIKALEKIRLELPTDLEELVDMHDGMTIRIDGIINDLGDATRTGFSPREDEEGSSEYSSWRYNAQRALTIAKIQAGQIKRAISKINREVNGGGDVGSKAKLKRITAEKEALKSLVRLAIRDLEEGHKGTALQRLKGWREALNTELEEAHNHG